eukprot:gene1311-11394_t
MHGIFRRQASEHNKLATVKTNLIAKPLKENKKNNKKTITTVSSSNKSNTTVKSEELSNSSNKIKGKRGNSFTNFLSSSLKKKKSSGLFSGLLSPKTSASNTNATNPQYDILEFKKDIIMPSFFELKDNFPFEFCITNETCSKYFQKCLERQLCADNFLFYRSVKKFEKEDKENRNYVALQIVETYFLKTSFLELNITNIEKENCKRKIKQYLNNNQQVPSTFFKEYLETIASMLKIDDYSKFLTSEEFKDYYTVYGEVLMKKPVESELWENIDSDDEDDDDDEFYNFFPSPSFVPGNSLFTEETTIRPKKEKLIFMVIDAMRFDMVSKMTKTYKKIKNKSGILIPSFAHPPTVTMPRLKAMTSGIMPGFLDVVYNLNSQEFKQDNWLHQMKSQNKTIILFGDETWKKLYPSYLDSKSDPTTSFFVTDTEIVDSNVTRHIDYQLNNPHEWDTLILHYLGLDHVGHIGGVKSSKMIPKIDEMDEIVNKISEWTMNRDDTLFIVCSDHGMTNDGNHGGATIDETKTFYLFFGLDQPKISEKNENFYVNQMDIVPTISLIMGLPIPINNIGVVIDELFDQHEMQSILKLNFNQISNKLNYYQKNSLKNWYEKIEKSTNSENLILNYKSFLKEASKILFTTTNTNASLIALGFGIGITSLTTLILFQMTFKSPINLVEYFLMLGTTLHLISLGSSSLIEEEHFIWFFFTTTLYIIMVRYRLQKNENFYDLIIMGVIGRILKSWNQSGIKNQGQMDIAKQLYEYPDILELFFIISLLFLLVFSLRRGIISFVLTLISSCLTYVHKMNYTTNNLYPQLVYGIVVLLIIHFIYKKDRRILQLSFYILLILIHKIHNSFLIILIILQSKFSNTIHNTIVHYWMSKEAFYSFGNSVSISTIDFSGAYTGLSTYNEFVVGTLMVILVYSGPLIFLLEKNVNINAFIQIRFTLKALSMSLFQIILLLMRNHLFIWSDQYLFFQQI